MHNVAAFSSGTGRVCRNRRLPSEAIDRTPWTRHNCLTSLRFPLLAPKRIADQPESGGEKYRPGTDSALRDGALDRRDDD
jgi:hypothetical protein